MMMMMRSRSRSFRLIILSHHIALLLILQCFFHKNAILTTSSFTVVSQRPEFRGGSCFSSSTTSSASSSTRTTTTGSTQLYASSSSYNKIFIAGASKGVGRQIVQQILERDSDDDNDGLGQSAIVALVRDANMAKELEALSTESHTVTAIVGDAMDQKTVENAMDGCDAAITTLGGGGGGGAGGGGGGSTTEPIPVTDRVDYMGNSNVIESAGILGITRIVLVTSIGCGNSRVATPDTTYEVLKYVIEAKNKAENLLLKYYTNSNWTIIRPGGLMSEKMTKNAILTSDPTILGLIHREDVARLVLQALVSSKTERQVLSAIDPTIESSFTLPESINVFEL